MEYKEFHDKFTEYVNIIINDLDEFWDFFIAENHTSLQISKSSSEVAVWSVKLYKYSALIARYEDHEHDVMLEEICEFLHRNLKHETLQNLLEEIQYKVIQSL